MSQPKTDYVLTPRARLAFPSLYEPKADRKGKLKYGATLLIPKTADISALKTAINDLVSQKFPDKAKRPPGLKLGIKDGDLPNGRGNIPTGYPGNWVVNAISTYAPGLVDERVQKVIDRNKFYAGCYVIAQINAFWFDTDGSLGVSFGLGNIQFVGDGERLGGGAPDAAQAFTAVPGSSAAAAAGGKTGDSVDDFLS